MCIRDSLKTLRRTSPEVLEKLPQLPLLVNEVLEQMQRGRLTVDLKPEELAAIRREIARSQRRNYGAIVGGALLVSATISAGLGDRAGTLLAGVPLLSWILGGLAVIVLYHARPGGR